MDNISLAMMPTITGSANARFTELKQRLDDDLFYVKSKVSGFAAAFAFNKLAYEKAVRGGNFADMALLLIALRSSEVALRDSVNDVASAEKALRVFVATFNNVTVDVSDTNFDISLTGVTVNI